MAQQKKLTPISQLRAAYGRPTTQYHDSGVFLINDIWGGGIPMGKMIELHSAEGLGKTTIAVQLAVYLISRFKLKVAYIDVESALDESLKTNLGAVKYEMDDPEEPSFLYLCPYTYDEVSKVLNVLMRRNYDLIIYDSITSTSLDIDESEEENFKISKKIGQHALLQGELLKMFKGRLARLGKTMIIINQMRANFKTIPGVRGPELKPAGGKALDHAFDIRTAITKVTSLYDNDKNRIGVRLRLTTIKNKVACPYRQVELELIFGKGINKVTTLFDVLKNKKIVVQKGPYFYFPGCDRSFQGGDAALQYIRENYQHCVSLVGDSSYQVNILGEKIAEGADITTGVAQTELKEMELSGISSVTDTSKELGEEQMIVDKKTGEIKQPKKRTPKKKK